MDTPSGTTSSTLLLVLVRTSQWLAGGGPRRWLKLPGRLGTHWHTKGLAEPTFSVLQAEATQAAGTASASGISVSPPEQPASHWQCRGSSSQLSLRLPVQCVQCDGGLPVCDVSLLTHFKLNSIASESLLVVVVLLVVVLLVPSCQTR